MDGDVAIISTPPIKSSTIQTINSCFKIDDDNNMNDDESNI